MKLPKQSQIAADVTGEVFFSALPSGYKTYAQDSGPFQRFLPHIEQRNDKLMGLNRGQAQGNYCRYDETDTVNQS